MDTAKLASVAVGIAFAIGVLYNFGYFAGIDLNFFTFLSYKDHLTVLVFFVPPSLLMALLFGVYRHKIPQLDWIARFLGMLVLISWTTRDQGNAMPSLNAFLFWFRGIASLFLIPYLIAVIVEFFSSADWAQQDARRQGSMGVCIIGLLVFIMMFGNFCGHMAVRAWQFEVEVTLATNDKTPSLPQPAHLVRAIDDGFFLILQSAPDALPLSGRRQ